MPNTSHPQEAFWFVWRDGGHSPIRRHESFAAARMEANRLANENRCQTFYVLQAVEGFAAPEPSALSWPLVTVTAPP